MPEGWVLVAEPLAVSDSSLVMGTGTAVVPSDPEDVLRVYVGSVADVTGTGMTVVPEDPVKVLEVYASPVEVSAGTGTTEVPSGPDAVLLVKLTAAVPEDCVAESDIVAVASSLASDELPVSTAGAGVSVAPASVVALLVGVSESVKSVPVSLASDELPVSRAGAGVSVAPASVVALLVWVSESVKSVPVSLALDAPSVEVIPDSEAVSAVTGTGTTVLPPEPDTVIEDVLGVEVSDPVALAAVPDAEDDGASDSRMEDTGRVPMIPALSV